MAESAARDRDAASEAGGGNEDIAQLGYEEARDELLRVVSELEQGSQTLERSLALWERGEALADHCEQWLVGARSRLENARATRNEQNTAQEPSGHRDAPHEEA